MGAGAWRVHAACSAMWREPLLGPASEVIVGGRASDTLQWWQGNRKCLHAQVAWQPLLDDSGDGSVLDDASAKGKASVAAAVLTSRRMLLLSATLHTLASVCPSPAQPRPTSLLWLGPALLFTTTAHQARPVCACAARANAHGTLVAGAHGAT